MPKQKEIGNPRNFNFRQTHSERSATISNRNFHKNIKKLFQLWKFRGTNEPKH